MPNETGFDDVRFPLRIGFGATGGPERRVEIVGLTSGFEKRNVRSAHAIRRFDAGTGARSMADLETIIAFFEARRGALMAFRFRDPFDHRTSENGSPISAFDVSLGEGDGTQDIFDLAKPYGDGMSAYLRPITCANPQSILVSVGGNIVQQSTYSIDAPGRAVRFNAGNIPASGQEVRAGFTFDVPVRFDIDTLTLSQTAFNAGEVPAIPLKEVLL